MNEIIKIEIELEIKLEIVIKLGERVGGRQGGRKEGRQINDNKNQYMEPNKINRQFSRCLLEYNASELSLPFSTGIKGLYTPFSATSYLHPQT